MVLERQVGKRGVSSSISGGDIYIFILNLSPVSRSSQLGKTHTNEMKDDIHQE